MNRWIAAFACLLLIGTGLAAADQTQSTRRYLSADEVREAFVGPPVAGAYTNGQSWREQMQADGSTHYVEERGTFNGRWWFNARSELCFEYDGNGGGGCFVYVRLSANCYEHFFEAKKGDSGTDLGSRGLVTNGKLWRANEPPTCEERPTV